MDDWCDCYLCKEQTVGSINPSHMKWCVEEDRRLERSDIPDKMGREWKREQMIEIEIDPWAE